LNDKIKLKGFLNYEDRSEFKLNIDVRYKIFFT